MGAEVSVSVGLYVLCFDVIVLCVSCAILGIWGIGWSFPIWV